jgi:hypothetical protein
MGYVPSLASRSSPPGHRVYLLPGCRLELSRAEDRHRDGMGYESGLGPFAAGGDSDKRLALEPGLYERRFATAGPGWGRRFWDRVWAQVRSFG